MAPENIDPIDEIKPFGKLLRFWRSVHGLSQEELAYSIDSSPRHISRMENSHVQPSQDMVVRLANHMQLNERDKNHLLVAAGFSPKVRRDDFFSDNMRWLRNAMTLTLRALDPYPTSLLGNDGEILMVNKGWVSFYEKIAGETSLDSIENLYEFYLSLRQGVSKEESWKNAWSMTLMSLKQEVLLNDDKNVEVILEKLLRFEDIPKDWAIRASKLDPMTSYKLPLIVEGEIQNFFNVTQAVSALGPAAYVSEPKLIINTLYPENDATDMAHIFNENARHSLLTY